MKCLRCHNEDRRMFAYDHGVYYCRKCVAFGRLNVGEQDQRPTIVSKKISVEPLLRFQLTPEQKRVSRQVLDHLLNHKNVFVYAATGAGKTEITFESICSYLAQGKKVGFAISRRQVVLELWERLSSAFPTLRVVAVTQGYTDELDGDLIVCTIHQLYRYPFTFDLLILDELDAFPYAQDPLLHQLVKNACKGERLCLSATIDEQLQKEIDAKKLEVVELFKRPHGKPLIEPKIIQAPVWFQFVLLRLYLECFIRDRKQTLVFVPTRKKAIWIKRMLWGISVESIHAQDPQKDEKMKLFKEKKWDVLVSTTLLERGITIDSVQVIVFQADDPVFTQASLIQIFGRVGRKFSDPYGKGICLCQFRKKSILSCVSTIQKMNRSV